MLATSTNVCIKLSNEDLWKEFNGFTTEMIVTKTGRKLFPKVEISVEGLEPDEQYVILLQIEPVGNTRFKFANGGWLPAGCADPGNAPKPLSHHDGAQLGKTWMRGPICFDRVKLTNCPADGGQRVYQSVFIVISFTSFIQ
ncbi:unnamed protein product [Enterobius vermicularis]|uniref:T-box domain-containing protein n=1 Tax=Enterobius vermicularis TaxID=51028 RepID=A0A0N4VIR4_ENTVE|nr:unnamed protein product [Enterobius vermicularis]